jgi:GGDEF domain-containing protein
MDVKPTIWERAARHAVAFRATVVFLAGVASALAYLAGRNTGFSAFGAVFAGCAFAAVWVGILIVLDRVEYARQRRYEGMGRIRDFAQRLVIYDRETGFYADWYFRLRLQEELTRSRRFGQPCALILAESTRGRLGREREAELFKSISRSFRATDLVAHMGSLRFAVLLTHTTREGAAIAGERLSASVPDGLLQIGFACFPEDGDDWRSLVAAAGGPSVDVYAGAAQDWAGEPDCAFDPEQGKTVA